MNSRAAISRTAAAVVIVIIIVAGVGGAILIGNLYTPSSSTTTTTAVSTSSLAQQGTLVIGTNIEPVTANPIYNGGTLPDFERLIFNGLVDINSNFEPVPDLAQNWTVSPDARVFTFNLVHGVLFQDGVPLTANDVVFTFQKYADPNVGFAYNTFGNMTVKALDNYTVQFSFPQPNPAFLVDAWWGILPQHLLGNIPDSELKEANFSTHPIGTGPYTLVNWVPQSEIDLVANNNYFKGPPHIHEIIIKIIPDTTAMVTAVQANEIDLWNTIAAAGGLTPLELQQALHPGYTTQSFPGSAMVLMMGPQSEAPWNNVLVRQAVLYSINRTALIDKFLPGGAIVWNTPWQTPWAVNPNLTPVYNYNVTKAEQLLTEAGYLPDANGVRLKTTIYATSGFRTEFSQVISSQLALAGIQATVQVVGDFTTYWNLLSNERTENGIYTFFESLFADPGAETDVYFLPSQIFSGGSNVAEINDTQLTSLLTGAETSPSLNARAQMYYQAENLVSQKAYAWTLWEYTGYNIVSDKIVGCPGTAVDGMSWACFDNATLTS